MVSVVMFLSQLVSQLVVLLGSVQTKILPRLFQRAPERNTIREMIERTLSSMHGSSFRHKCIFSNNTLS